MSPAFLFLAIYTATAYATLQISMQDTAVFVNVSAIITWTRSQGDPTKFLIYDKLQGGSNAAGVTNLPNLPAVNTTDDVFQGTVEFTTPIAGLHRIEAWDPKNTSNVLAFSYYNALRDSSGDNTPTTGAGPSTPNPSPCSSCVGSPVPGKPSSSSSASTSATSPTSSDFNQSQSPVNTAALAGGIVGGFVILIGAVLAIWILCCRRKARRLRWVEANQPANKEGIDPFNIRAKPLAVPENKRRRSVYPNDQRTSVGGNGDYIGSPTSTSSDGELIARIQELERLTAMIAASATPSGEGGHSETPPSYVEPRRRSGRPF